MKTVPIYIRPSDLTIQPEYLGSLSQENNLIYNDEGGGLKAHINTSLKFTLLTASSPLISVARLIRSAVFLVKGEFEHAKREFIGSLATPFVATGCCLGSLAAFPVYVLSSGSHSFYTAARRTYAHFEAWVNQLDPASSYSQRTSRPLEPFKGPVWTTAPCMQPLLENGFSSKGGLLDRHRMQKIFPLMKINHIQMEKGRVVIRSEYPNELFAYSACNGLFQHGKISSTCCCFQIEAIYDRFLCCEVSKGSCTSLFNSGDNCGYVSAGCCGIHTCCCYTQENHSTIHYETGCFGTDPCYI